MPKSISDGRINGNIIPGRPTSNASIHFKLRSGRDRTQIKRWWNSGGNNKNYIDCSAAQVTLGEDGCKFWLVWPHNYDTRLDVEWSLKFGTLKFTKFRHATRAALLCEDGTVLSHYVFGKQPSVKPREFKVTNSWICPDGCTPAEDSGDLRCYYIYELPDLGSSDPPAPKSVSLFEVCIDVPGLPLLV